MKINVEKSAILEAALPSAGFASGKNTIAATEGILFSTVGADTCELCAYDLEKGMKTSVNCTVLEEGRGIINCQRFIQIVRAMPEGILTIEINEGARRARITGGKAEFELQAIDGKSFPDLPELRGDRGFLAKQKDFRRLLTKTQFAIAVNAQRPEINGLNLKVKDGTLTAVSCDGNRLAVFSEKRELESIGTSELAFDIILPGKTVNELLRFVSDTENEMKMYVARKHVVFFIGSFVLFSRLIDAQYIDYERFIPKSPKIFAEVNTASMLGALERALLVTEERHQGELRSPVICLFEGNELSVSSSSISGRVNDVMAIKKEGEDLEIGFNCRFLADALRVCDSEHIRISMTSALMGMTIEPVEIEEGKRFLLLVLPVRLNK